MTDKDKLTTKLIFEQDQDEAAGSEWWEASTKEDKLRVWTAIQQLPGVVPDEITLEIISRFAQLGFTHLCLKARKQQ